MPELKGRMGYWLKLAESAAFRKILICAQNTHTAGSINERGNRHTAWKSCRVIKAMEEQEQNESGENATIQNESGINVALSALYNARAIFSCRNCKNSRNCINACRGNYKRAPGFDKGIVYPFADVSSSFDLDMSKLHVGEIVFSFATG